jgi:hypothetical protein
MTNATLNTGSSAKGHAPLPKYDVSKHAREGGIASGISRRLRPHRALEAKVLASSNGAAAYALLRDKRVEQAQLLAEQRRADDLVCRLMDEADAERRTIARLQERSRELEADLSARIDARQAELADLERQAAAHKTPEGIARFIADVPEATVFRGLELAGHDVEEIDDAAA